MDSWLTTTWGEGKILNFIVFFMQGRVSVKPTVQNVLPKARVCALWVDGFLTDPLQSGHPAGGQVAVLQYHPGALFDGFVNHLSCYGSLSLSERNGLGLTSPHF